MSEAEPTPPPPAPTEPNTELTAEGADGPVAQLIAMIQEARAGAGVAPLAWSAELAEAAVTHVQDMATHGFVSHTGSDGSDIVNRMQRAGYDPSWRGEIIVQTSADPSSAFAWWWSSQLHHHTMLGPSYRDVGVAIAPHPGDNSRAYYVVVFGRR